MAGGEQRGTPSPRALLAEAVGDGNPLGGFQVLLRGCSCSLAVLRDHSHQLRHSRGLTDDCPPSQHCRKQRTQQTPPMTKPKATLKKNTSKHHFRPYFFLIIPPEFLDLSEKGNTFFGWTQQKGLVIRSAKPFAHGRQPHKPPERAAVSGAALPPQLRRAGLHRAQRGGWGPAEWD